MDVQSKRTLMNVYKMYCIDAGYIGSWLGWAGLGSDSRSNGCSLAVLEASEGAYTNYELILSISSL